MFLVIDGSSMLTTAYYANLPREIKFERDEEKQKLYYDKILHTKDGEYTNAVYGMTRELLNIILNQKPDYLAIVFDKTRNTFRRELYSEYKAQRKPSPAPLKQQFAAMEQIVEKLGIQCLYSDNVEADDFAGSIVKKFSAPNCPIRFLTKDHDYLQLINDYTRGWVPQTKDETLKAMEENYLSPFGISLKDCNLPNNVFEFTAETTFGEEGVWPEQIPDKKGLCGDSSDNIPGVKGVGETSVIPLLAEYKTVEGIYEAIDDCMGDAKKEKELAAFWKNQLKIPKSPLNQLKANREMAFLSKKLATIKTDCEIPDTLDQYTYSIDADVLKDILSHYEFKSLIDVAEQFATERDDYE